MRCALVWVGLILFVTVTFPELPVGDLCQSETRFLGEG